MRKTLFAAVLSLASLFASSPEPKPQAGAGSSSGGIVSVSNGISVDTSDVLWYQLTGAGGNMYFMFRMQLPDGSIYDSTVAGTSWNINGCGASGGGYGTGIFFPRRGILLAAQALSETAGIYNGMLYGQIYLLRSMPTGGNNTACQNIANIQNFYGVPLAGCNMTSFYSMGWTVGGGCLITSPVAGPGAPTNLNPSSPGAGANIALNARGSNAGRTQVVAIHFRLVTSATAASRQVCITFGTSGGTILNTLCAAGTQAASQTVDYDFQSGPGGSCPAALITGSGCVTGFANPYYLQGGVDDSWQSVITNIQSGDQVSDIWVKLLRWNETD